MSDSALRCESCGASEIRWTEGRLACTYCGATFTPRLVPGTLCGDLDGGCLQPAQTVCRGCGRPLCDRHNDPKLHYWNASLMLEALLPQWGADEARAWAQLVQPFQKFPVPGVEGMAWQGCERENLQEIGELEERVVAAVEPLVHACGGDIAEYACQFESLCGACERRVLAQITTAVSAFAAEYRVSAYENRLEAIEADLKQALAGVQAFLGRDVPAAPEGLGDEAQFTSLTVDSDPAEWDRCGWEIRRRLRLVAGLVRRFPR